MVQRSRGARRRDKEIKDSSAGRNTRGLQKPRGNKNSAQEPLSTFLPLYILSQANAPRLQVTSKEGRERVANGKKNPVMRFALDGGDEASIVEYETY